MNLIDFVLHIDVYLGQIIDNKINQTKIGV